LRFAIEEEFEILPNRGSTELVEVKLQIANRKFSILRRTFLLLIPIALYVALVIPATWNVREAINPDGICYIRRAMYLNNGWVERSASAYWSPMISWSIVPLLRAGVDALHAAHWTLGIWGGLYMLAAGWFLHRVAKIRGVLLAALMCVIGLFAIHIAISVITPDLLLSTWLFIYLGVVYSPRLLERRWLALVIGAIGACAFLAKAYAFPFFFAHFAFTLLLAAWVEKRLDATLAVSQIAKRVLITGFLGTIAFVVVTGPWIALLSYRYHKFTISTVGEIAHAYVGPHDEDEDRPDWFQVPPPPYIIRNEYTDYLPRPSWSPFESEKNFVHQIKLIGTNSVELLSAAGSLDVLWLPVVALLLLPFAGRRLFDGSEDSSAALWMVGTLAIYCGGFLFIYFEPRYVNTMILPLAMGLCIALLRLLGLRWGMLSLPPVYAALASIVVISFLFPRVEETRDALQPRSFPRYREIAEDILNPENGFKGPMASTALTRGTYLAYHLGMPFVGFPPDRDIDEVERRLFGTDMGILVLWRPRPDVPPPSTKKVRNHMDEIADEMIHRPGWRRMLTRKWNPTTQVEVYVHKWPKKKASTTQATTMMSATTQTVSEKAQGDKETR
jgi:hypothetical protein